MNVYFDFCSSEEENSSEDKNHLCVVLNSNIKQSNMVTSELCE